MPEKHLTSYSNAPLRFAYFFRDLATFMISAMLHKDDTSIHVIMNFMRIWKINAEVKIILLGVGLWHGLLTLQWVTMQMPIMATSMASHTPVKAPDFSLTKKPNWCWPNHNYGFEYALWRTTERKKHAAKNQTFIRCWVIMCISAPCR